jgi:hypothetical protein
MSRHFSTRTADRRVEYRRLRGQHWPALIIVGPECGATVTKPNGGTVTCHAPFEPICSTYRCPARKHVLAMLRAEREPEPTRYAGTLPDGSWGYISEEEARRQRLEVDRPTRYRGKGKPRDRRADAARHT